MTCCIPKTFPPPSFPFSLFAHWIGWPFGTRSGSIAIFFIWQGLPIFFIFPWTSVLSFESLTLPQTGKEYACMCTVQNFKRAVLIWLVRLKEYVLFFSTGFPFGQFLYHKNPLLGMWYFLVGPFFWLAG